MRFGICSTPDEAPALAGAGFDFVEWPVNQTVGDMDERAYQSLLQRTRDLPIAPEAWNVLLPRSIKVVGPEVDHSRLRHYVETALSRAAELGGQVVVFGSGPSRAVPGDWPMDIAREQFCDACRIVGDIAGRHGITIAIEPLNRAVSNLINTVSEGASVVQDVAHPRVQLLSDLSHVQLNGEALSDTGAVVDVLAHVHISHPFLRTVPRADEAEPVYKEYFKILHRTGYAHRISIECSPPLPTVAEAGESLAYLRDLWETTNVDAVVTGA
jgi:sugar phosphate isomerase/epimerase